MGQFKKEYFDNFQKTPIIEKKICAYHVEDDFINSFIKKKGKIDTCDYCNRRKKVIQFEDFFSILEVGINYLFEDASDSRYIDHDGEHGLDGNTFLAFDIVYDDKLDLRIDDDTLFKDINESIDKDVIYCERGEFGDLKDYYNGEWSHFKEIVKHKARFVFYFEETFKVYFHTNPIMILNNIQGEIINQNLFKELTPSDKIYRCTQHFLKDDVKKDGKRIASNPIENCKTNNRMSPAGISMFYGSIDKKTSTKEVLNFKDKINLFYTVAYFTPIQNLKLVDLTKFPKLPSIFDKKNNKFIQPILFLKDFVKDISQPIDSKDSIIEYIPTQIVTEYIKFNPDLAVDGIIYPSAKDKNIANYVLFMDNETSLSKLKFHYGSRETKKIKTIKTA